MAASGREFLGKRRGFGEVHRAYLRGTALEVDTYDWYDLRRRRIQLDEVQRITLHHEVRAAALVLFVALTILLLGIAALLFRTGGDGVGWLLFAILGSSALVLALLVGLGAQHVVNVTSPRARVTIVNSRRRARAVYRLLAERTETAQTTASSARQEAPRAS